MQVFFDLVVQVGHGFAGMPQPELLQTIWAGRVIPQECIPETPERVITGFVVAGMRVDEVQCLQRRMQVTPNDIGRTNRFSLLRCKQEARLPVPSEFLV